MAKRVCAASGDAWMWMAFAPVSRLVLAFVVGKRAQERANWLRPRVAHVTAERLPLCTSDQLPRTAPPCPTSMDRGGNRLATGIEGVSPGRDESRRRICSMRMSSHTAAEDTSWG